jgi:hypothetical protein
MTSTAKKSAMAAGGSQSGSLLPRAVMFILRVAACGYAASGTARAQGGERGEDVELGVTLDTLDARTRSGANPASCFKRPNARATAPRPR